MKTNRKAFGILFGVVPEHQGKGLDGAMVIKAREVLQDQYDRYDEYEINWIGDFNPTMINVVKQVGALNVKDMPPIESYSMKQSLLKELRYWVNENQNHFLLLKFSESVNRDEKQNRGLID